MIKIRKNTFETNSSSTHSLVVCDEDTWDNFVCGRLFYNVLSRHHDEYLKKYPLEEFETLPEHSGLNELPIFCSFKDIKNYVYSMHHTLEDDYNFRLRQDVPLEKRVRKVEHQLIFLPETFYAFEELEGFNYDVVTHTADLDYYFG